jgi:hypothetical protein
MAIPSTAYLLLTRPHCFVLLFRELPILLATSVLEIITVMCYLKASGAGVMFQTRTFMFEPQTSDVRRQTSNLHPDSTRTTGWSGPGLHLILYPNLSLHTRTTGLISKPSTSDLDPDLKP